MVAIENRFVGESNRCDILSSLSWILHSGRAACGVHPHHRHIPGIKTLVAFGGDDGGVLAA
jgi:hypothetical protein